jgi:hypothetical protein
LWTRSITHNGKDRHDRKWTQHESSHFAPARHLIELRPVQWGIVCEVKAPRPMPQCSGQYPCLFLAVSPIVYRLSAMPFVSEKLFLSITYMRAAPNATGLSTFLPSLYCSCTRCLAKAPVWPWQCEVYSLEQTDKLLIGSCVGRQQQKRRAADAQDVSMPILALWLPYTATYQVDQRTR